MTDFGSPNAGDSTARRERRIIRAAERRNRRILSGVNVINRPSGSKVDQTREEKLADWMYQMENPDVMQEAVTQRAQVVGPVLAGLELLEWDASMRKMGGQDA